MKEKIIRGGYARGKTVTSDEELRKQKAEANKKLMELLKKYGVVTFVDFFRQRIREIDK